MRKRLSDCNILYRNMIHTHLFSLIQTGSSFLHIHVSHVYKKKKRTAREKLKICVKFLYKQSEITSFL